MFLLMRLHLAQPKPLLQPIQKQNHPSLLQTEEINAKANTPVVPADKAKLAMSSLGRQKLAHLLKTDGADTTTTSTANHQND